MAAPSPKYQDGTCRVIEVERGPLSGISGPAGGRLGVPRSGLVDISTPPCASNSQPCPAKACVAVTTMTRDKKPADLTFIVSSDSRSFRDALDRFPNRAFTNGRETNQEFVLDRLRLVIDVGAREVHP